VASAIAAAVGMLLAGALSGCGSQGVAVSWNTVSSPNPAGGVDVDLDSVACAPSGDCWAVGFYQIAAGSGTESLPLVERNAGSGWAIVPSPSPAGASGALLYAVTCAGTGCWAVGSSTDQSGDTQTLVEQDTGSGWSVVASPTPSGATNVGLDAVACSGSNDCWAAGSYTDASKNFQTLVEQDLGGVWTVAGPPATPGELFGLTCAGAGDCWAVGGSSGTTGGTSAALIEHDTGDGWKAVSSPSPAHSTESELSGVICAGASDCWAAGSSAGANGNSQALIERNTGSGWRIVYTPAPSGSAADDLNGVACAGGGECWAVGSSTQTSSSSPTLIEQWSGGGWSVVSSPDPASSPGSALQAVACASASDCWAVGSYTTADDNTQTLIAHT